MPGRLDQLPGRPTLDASQGDVSRLDLIGFHPLSKRFGQAIVEVGELLGQAVLLAAVSGRLEESISLDKRCQLGLDNDPLLLIKRGLGNVVAMGGLVPELNGLSQRDINEILTIVIKALVVARDLRPCSEGAVGHEVDRSIIDPHRRVERCGKVPGDLDGLGGSGDGVPLAERDEVGITGDCPVKSRLQADRLAAGRRRCREGREVVGR